MWTARVTIVKILAHNSAAIVSQCTGILTGDREELFDMKVFTFQYFSFWGLEIKAFPQHTLPILHIDSLSTGKFTHWSEVHLFSDSESEKENHVVHT